MIITNLGEIDVRRFIWIAMLAGLIVLLSSSLTLAAVPQDVQQAANDGIKQFIPVLDSEKSHYVLAAGDQTGTATLGEGHQVYVVSTSAVKNYQATSGAVLKAANLFVPRDSYVFPIKVGNKPAGVLFVEKDQGKWEATQISSDLTFESALKNAQDNINNTVGANKPAAVNLVYDQSVHMAALSAQGVTDEFLIPLADNKLLNLKKNEKVSIKSEADKLASVATPNNAPARVNGLGGTGSSQGPVDNNPWVCLIVLVVVLIAAGVYIGWRKFACKQR